MKRTRVWLVAGLCLIFGGVVLGYGPFIQNWRSAHVPRVAASPFLGNFASAQSGILHPEIVISGKPVRLQIPSLNIDLPIVDGQYNAKRQTWTLSNDKVHYAAMTAPANNAQGNTFLYGHNKKGLFNTLNRIQLNAEAIITTDNDHTFTYTFEGALETVPTDDSLFHYDGKPILTIQTCSGTWYQNRQLFTFDFKEAN
jgi:LPXTG-site transpeptidase (sortase) family protein